MNRLDIINHLINRFYYKRYLEIGVHVGETLDGCIAPYKIGIDPDFDSYKGKVRLYPKTSDDFFERVSDHVKFDIVFIDGMHEAKQVFKDIRNSLFHLNPKGIIVMHDCSPPTEWHTRSYEEFKKTGGDWNGDVYKGYIEAVNSFNVHHFTINTDWGVGIIYPYTIPIMYSKRYSLNLSWEEFNKNREILLHLISEEEFLTMLTDKQQFI
jgi:hypothetical protein